MKIAIIFLLSGLTGFLSLSQEIIWIRILMYATGGIPQVFAYVLGFFLIGIAVGSWWSKRQIEDGININHISKLFFTSSIILFFLHLDKMNIAIYHLIATFVFALSMGNMMSNSFKI